MLKTNEDLTLDNCDREPIHVPGSVQPFAAVLAGPSPQGEVTHASANIDALLGIEAEALLGRPFSDVLPREALHDVRNILGYSTAGTQRERVGCYELPRGPVEVYAHRNPDGLAVLEVEALGEARDDAVRSPIEQARLFLAKASAETSIERLLKVCAVGLREITGYDRVKAYRYAEDGSGEVVAESRAAGVPSFLGLRYPAWDVPAQARALQVKNPLRLLSDVDQDPVPILAARADAAPLDLSLAHTRGISPIHVEYLRNMGVGGTLTIGLVVDGRLWGMFACHHMSSRVIGSDTRIAAELFGQMVSLLLKARQENQQIEARARAAGARQQIVAETGAAADLLHAFPSMADILSGLVRCDGVAVLRDDKLQTQGSVPSVEAIRAIGRGHAWDENLLLGTDYLSDAAWHHVRGEATDLGDTAGCLIVRATSAFPLQLMFFRDAKTRAVRWAGKPDKDYETGPYGRRITPRGSFDAYLEEQHGRADPWTPFDMTAAREIQVMLTQITAKAEKEQLSRHKDMVSHQRQQDLMIAELNHRVKNILALIRSLSRQAKQSSASLESYALALEQRIAALAAAHDLAVSDSMRGVSLRGILDTELGPYVASDASQVMLSGPTVGLRADVAPMIALVFHEIVSNAAKYGALSTGEGIVQAKWSVDDEHLRFSWRELGGPPVEPPKRHGFGRSLIERAIPYEFDGKVSLDYDPGGLRFAFELPVRHLVDLEDETTPALAPQVSEIKRIASGRAVLLVEDNVVLAMDMVESITRLGAERVETAATIADGLRAVETDPYDFAVLDMNLRGEVAFDLALTLRAKKVPFVFVTGYGSKIDVPPDLRDVPILTKPVDDGTLSRGIEGILA